MYESYLASQSNPKVILIMEFLPQPDELTPNVQPTSTVASSSYIVEEEVAAIEIGNQEQSTSTKHTNLPHPIHFSDGILYPNEQNKQIPESTNGVTDTQVALPDNLIEVYRHLGLLGKLLTGGSLVTIRFMQAFRTISENIVDVLGITRPKYEYEINLYKQMQEEEEQRKQKLGQLYAGWQQQPDQSEVHCPPAESVPSVQSVLPIPPTVTIPCSTDSQSIMPPSNMALAVDPSSAVQYTQAQHLEMCPPPNPVVTVNNSLESSPSTMVPNPVSTYQYQPLQY